MSSDNVLLKRSKEILESIKNTSNLYLPSSRENISVRRSFDSIFLLYGYLQIDLDETIRLYKSNFDSQWKDGMLPGSVFYKDESSHFPDINFWNKKEENELGPKDIMTSSFIYPAMNAILLWDIYVKVVDKKGEKEGKKILEDFYSKILLSHQYLMDKRDFEKSGAITIHHPFESGFLHSSRFSEILDKVSVKGLMAYSRMDEDHYDKKQFDALVYLAQGFLKEGTDFKEAQFQVKDLFSSCVSYLGNKKLRKMTVILNKNTSEIDTWISRFEMNFIKTFFNEDSKTFCDYDIVSGKFLEENNLLSATSLITGLMSSEFLERTVDIFLEKEIPRIKKIGLENISSEDVVFMWIILKGFSEYSGEYKGLRKVRGILRDILRKKVSLDENEKDGEFEYVLQSLLLDVLVGDEE